MVEQRRERNLESRLGVRCGCRSWTVEQEWGVGEEYLPWPYPRGRGGGDSLTSSLRGFALLLAVMLKAFLIYVASRWV